MKEVFCEKCGAKNDSSSKFCEKCGNSLTSEETKTKKSTENSNTKVEKTSDVKQKISNLSKKQKLFGGIGIGIIVLVVVFYFVGSKITSVESIGEKAFKQLTEKETINKKYLTVSLDSDDYFISLKDTLKNILEKNEIEFNYSKYKVSANKKSAVVKYYDTEEEENYKITFDVEKDGKTMLFFDKYVISKITLEEVKGYDSVVLYDPSDTEKITLTTVKGSKITIDDKKITDKYKDSKKSNDENDVYVIKGFAKGSYDVVFNLKNLEFKKSIYVYLNEDNEYDLTDYISYSYIKGDSKEYIKSFKNYISTYYEYVNDTSKTIDDFSKKYAVTDEIKKLFAESKDYAANISSFKIDDVTIRSLYYYSDDKELNVTFKVNYTYKMSDAAEEKTSYDTVRVTYKLDNIELPIDLNYMPY